MTPLTALWLPILLSAVIAFIASSIIHMFLGYHAGDYPAVPDEQKFRDAVGPLGIPPGDYMVPRASTTAEMRTPEFDQKMKDGPVVVMTIIPPGPMAMGRSLALWFVYQIIISLFAGYIASRALGTGADYLDVFRFAGTTAFLGYAAALWQMTIWYRRSLGTTIRSTIDGLIYALLTAGVFGWLWPR
ncbi:MAG TPA: hypothetical protein VFO89_05365 [Thermoanaerobaculia bacterium]|nr:hypothetical protein [Thermoanaerobaculia bacterium]